VSAREEMRQKL